MTAPAVTVGTEDGFTFDGGGLFGNLNVEDSASFSTINGWLHTGAFNIGSSVTGTISSGVSLSGLSVGTGSALNFLAGGVVSGATSISGAITINAEMNFLGVVDLISGSIGGAGTPRFAGTMNWSGGTIGGVNPTLPAGSTLNILTSAPKFVGALAFNLEGTTNWSGTGLIGVAPSIFEPDVINRGTISITEPGVRGFARFADGGIGWFDFTNEGNVDVGTGTFQAEHLGLGHPGDFSVASGALLELDGWGLTAFGSITGAGSARLRWSGDSFGPINLGGTLSLPGGDVEFKSLVSAAALEVGPVDPLWTSTAAFRSTTTITGDVTVHDAFAEFGMPGFGNTASIGGNLRVLDNPGPPFSGVTFHAALNLPTGTATFAGGTSRFHGTFLSPNTPVFSGGSVIFHSDTTFPVAPTINGGTIQFLEDLNVPDATFAAGTVRIYGVFNSPVDPDFFGSVVEFLGTYAAPASLLRVIGGAVAFLNPSVNAHAFQAIELRGGGVIRATTDRTVSQGPVTLIATSSMDWQTGTVRDINLRVQHGATFTASGGAKRFENTYPNQGLFGISLNFDTLAWSDGNFVLLNNVAFGGSLLASSVTKTGPGNIVTTTTIPPSGAPEWFPAITLGLMDHVWSGQTTIEGAYAPRNGVGHTRINSGELRLQDYLQSPFYGVGGTLQTGQWTISGTLTLQGATVHTIGSSAAVTMSGVGARFDAIGELSANNGTLTYDDGYVADVTPAADVFSNSGTMNFRGGKIHKWRKPIANDGLVSVYEAGTILLVKGGISGAGVNDTGIGPEAGEIKSVTHIGLIPTILVYTHPTPFTGDGRVSFVGDFETVFNTDAQILVGELILDSHRFSGAGALTITSAVTYSSVTIAAGAGAYRIGLFGSFTPGSPSASISLERSLVNDGTLEGSVDTTALGLLTNSTTGELVVWGVTGAGALVNQGTLRSAAGAPMRHITTPYTHASTVPLDLTAADLRIASSITNTGTFAVDGTGKLDLDGDVSNSSPIVFDGSGEIRFAPGARLDSSIDTEVRSSTLVFSDANELTGPGTVILAGQVQYGVLVLGTGGSLVISASGSLMPASTASSLVVDRAINVHGLLGGLITTQRGGIITIENAGTLDLYEVSGLGEVHNYGLIRNTTGDVRSLNVPLLQASSRLFEAPGMGLATSIILQRDVVITGTFGITLGSGLLRTEGPVLMTAGSVSGFGQISVAGSFTVSGGAFDVGPLLVVEPTGSLIIDREASGAIPWGSIVRNFGTVEWRRGSLSGSGSLENRTNSQFLLTAGEGEHVWSRSGSTTASIANFDGATVERIGAGGSQLFYIPFNLSTGSALRILGGDFGALRGGNWFEGADVASGSTLYLGTAFGETPLLVGSASPITGGGNVSIGGIGFNGSSTFNGSLNIGGDLTLLSGNTNFNSSVVAWGDLRVEGGATTVASFAFVNGFGTFSAGTFTATALPVSILGTVLFSGTTATFHSDFACQNAEFRSGTVTFIDAFITNAEEPSFTGGHVQFGDEYDASTAHILVQAGSVRFDDDITLGHVELLGGTLFGDLTRSALDGATRFVVTERLDWGGGVFQDLRVNVDSEADFNAFGGLKRLSFGNTALAAPMSFGELAWTLGDIDLRDGASLQGGVIAKSGPGNLTRSTTIPPPGGGAWQGDVIVDIFQHLWGGTTAIDAQWNPGTNGEMMVQSGGVTLNDQSEFISGNTLTAGRWTLASGTTLAMPGAQIRTSQADITITGSSASFAALFGLTTNEGALHLLGGRAFNFVPLAGVFTNGVGSELILRGGTTHSPTFSLHNGGLTDLDAGAILNLVGSGSNAGQFLVRADSQLSFSSDSLATFTHSGAEAFAGGGRVIMGGRTHAFNSGTIISVAEINATSTTFGGTGSVLLTGQMTYATGATIIFASNFTVGPTGRLSGIGATFIRATFVNHGVVTASSSFNLDQATAVLTNAADGVLNLSNHTILGSGTLTNAGTINVAGSNVAISIATYNHQSTIPFNIDPASVLLDISSPVTNSGTFAVNGAGLLRLSGATVATHTGTEPFAGAGRIELRRTNNFTAQDAVISATNINASNMTFGGTGSVLLAGQMTLVTGATIIFASNFTVGPTGRLSGIGSTFIRATFVNHGIVTASSSFNLDQATAVLTNAADGVLNLSNHTILGSGTLTNAGTINVTTGTAVITATFAQQTGTIRVLGGTLTLPAFPQLAAGTLSGGKLSVHAGILNLPGAITTIGSGAAVELTHPSAVMSSISGLHTVNGAFRLSGGRNFTTAGHLTNSGSLDLSTSILNVSGNYTQTDEATLRLSLGATTHGRLNATGTAFLDGDLRVTSPGFLPPLGSEYRLLNAASVVGMFDSGLFNGMTFSYDATGVTVKWLKSAATSGPLTAVEPV